MFHLSVYFIEICSLGFFALALRDAARLSRARAAELFLALIYGLMLEELNIYFFRTYAYHPAFFMKVVHAPVSIALLWSLILLSSMGLSDRLGIPGFAKPFADGLLALLVDIGVDAIAIRLGYWSWKIPLSAGWFGVPAGNLYSWMWVAFSYSALTRVVRRLGDKDPGRYAYQWIVPFAAYLALFIEISVTGITASQLGWLGEEKRLWIFYGHVAVFSAITGLVCLLPREKKRGETMPRMLLVSRLAIHAYFLLALFLTGMAGKNPALALVALSAFAVELALKRAAS